MNYFSHNKHLTTDFQKSWKDEFGDNMYFSHTSSNSCRVLTAFHDNQNICSIKMDEYLY